MFVCVVYYLLLFDFHPRSLRAEIVLEQTVSGFPSHSWAPNLVIRLALSQVTAKEYGSPHENGRTAPYRAATGCGDEEGIAD